MRERELPALAAIGGILRWFEELAVIVSGPVLTGGLAIALVDLLTDGRLLAREPALLYAWAVSQAVGVDAQLVGAAAKVRAAIRARRPWVVTGYLLLVALLAYVAYVASLVFATQQADGITTAQALARLGMDSTSWLIQRSAIAVGLVMLSGFLRYVPPAEISAEDERAKIERELQLEPLRAELRTRQALGWRNLGRSILQGSPAAGPESHYTSTQDDAGMAQQAGMTNPASRASEVVQRNAGTQGDGDNPDPEPPDAPDTPPSLRPNGREAGGDGEPFAGSTHYTPSLALLPRRRASVAGARGRLSRDAALRVQAFALLDANPGMSRNALRAALKVRRETASRLYTEWQHERARQRAAR